jgi:hypothetical protein
MITIDFCEARQIRLKFIQFSHEFLLHSIHRCLKIPDTFL